MPNTYFSFKQFTIHQDKCAMKVCTDACILGAWFANKIHPYQHILDIGSGTGLIMLMLAQKTNASIQGIEIDAAAFEQLQNNIRNSPWASQLQVAHADIRDYSFPHQFDFIISNPPFFENDLVSVAGNEQTAKHSKDLTLAQLITCIQKHLTPDGSFGILLPWHRRDYFDNLATHQGFYLSAQLAVQQSPQHPYFRAILQYKRSPQPFIEQESLIIKNSGNQYTHEFVELLRDYYLKL